MSFRNPILLFGLLGALVPILIHLIHKRRPRKQAFAAIELLLRSVERIEKRWRIKRLLLLAARVSLLAALAVAAAGPLLGARVRPTMSSSGPERLAIVVDASLSMRARFEEATAFERAVVEAKNLVHAMGSEDQAIIVAAKRRPELLVTRPTADRNALLRALDALEPSYGHADVGEAASAAAESLGSLSSSEEGAVPGEASFAARVVVLSDLAQPGYASPAELVVPGSGRPATLELVDVLSEVPAAERRNDALVSAEASNVPGAAPRTIDLRARIQSFSSEAESTPEPREISLRSKDAELAGGSVEVVAGTIVDKSLYHAFARAGHHAVEVVLEGDALPEDNKRYAAVDVKQPVRTLLVDGAPSGVPKEDEIFYLERALHAGASDQPAPRVIGADDLTRTDLEAFDVVLLAGVPSLSRSDGARLAEFVTKGGGLFISVADNLDFESYNAELATILPRPFRGLKVVAAEEDVAGGSAPVSLANPKLDHALMELFVGDALGGLLSTRTRAYALLEPGGQREMEVLVEHSDGQPALVEASAGEGRVVILTTSIDRDLSDLSIRPAFLPLMRQVLLWLGGGLAKPDPRRTVVGEPREIRAAAGARSLKVLAPNGEERIFEGEELKVGPLTYAETELPGHYRVEATFAGGWEELAAESFAVNVDTRESDLRPLAHAEALAVLLGQGDAGGGDVSAALLRARSFGGALDPEILAGALLLFMALAFVLESLLTAQRIGS